MKDQQYYTIRVKEKYLNINKRFEITYTATRHQTIIDVIEKHSHYDEAPYSIEAVIKRNQPIPSNGYGY